MGSVLIQHGLQGQCGEYFESGHPTVNMIEVWGALYYGFGPEFRRLRRIEKLFVSKLAQLNLLIDGIRIASDASYSLRLSDGVGSGV